MKCNIIKDLHPERDAVSRSKGSKTLQHINATGSVKSAKCDKQSY